MVTSNSNRQKNLEKSVENRKALHLETNLTVTFTRNI
jgi:hypothetical protein